MNLKGFYGVLAGVLLLAGAPLGATESDVAKEQRWADQIVDGLLDGEAVRLDDGAGYEFLAILTEADDASQPAVILLHGIGVHPNWPDVIYPLRAGLLEQGFTTLSLQMPILPNEAEQGAYAKLFPEVPGRLNAAMAYLQELGYGEIVIVGHSMGASMAVYYLRGQEITALHSAVLIGMGRGDAWRGSIEALAEVRVPLLDLYGGEDLDIVLSSVEDRAMAGSRSVSYHQLRVDGANHFFQGHEAELLRAVLDWLQSS